MGRRCKKYILAMTWTSQLLVWRSLRGRFNSFLLRKEAPRKDRMLVRPLYQFSLKPRKCIRTSPYKSGMLMLNMPNRQYAMSSTLVVCLSEAQDILCAILVLNIFQLFFRTSVWIPVVWDMASASPFFVPIWTQFLSKNITLDGAMRSWSPPSCEPAALLKVGHGVPIVDCVVQVCITHLRVSIIPIHRIDCFGNLVAVPFIDATGVYPDILKLI